MTDPIRPHPSHTWKDPDRQQTTCTACGAYRHLSSGFEECEPERAGAVALPDQPTSATRPTTALELLSTAVSQKMDPAGLAALTAWAKETAAEEARRRFNEDMVRCQAAMPSIVNDSQNPSTQSRYPKFETLLRTAKPVWTRHGFSLSFGTDDCPHEGSTRVVCDVRHIDGHVERYRVDVQNDGIGPQGNPIGKMNKPQASGSTMAYGQRYLTKLIFCLAFADEDDDAVNARANSLTADQIGEINDLIEQCEKAGNPVNYEGFLKWLDVETLAELRQIDFPKARKELQRKLKGGKK